MRRSALLVIAFLAAGAASAVERAGVSLPAHLPVAVRYSSDKIVNDCPLPQVLVVNAGEYPDDAVNVPLFVVFRWDGALPDINTALENVPGEVAACGLELPPKVSGPAAETALREFSAAVKKELPLCRTAAIFSRPFQVERSPAVDLAALRDASVAKLPGWRVFRHLSFATWRKTLIAPGELTAREVVRGAAWGHIPNDEDVMRRLTVLRGLISIHDRYSFPEEPRIEKALFLLPDGLSGAPDWWLRQLDGWFDAALDAGLYLRVLQAGEVTPRDIERYGVVIVPVAENIGKGAARAIARVASSGGVVVLGGVPRGEGKDILLALSGMEANNPVVRYEQKVPPQGGVGRFRKVSLRLPEVGTQGIGRLWSGTRAVQAEVFLGRADAPAITVRKVADGWVSFMNIDLTGYARLSRSGLSGAAEIRALLRFWAGRGRVGVPLGERDGWRVWGMAGGDWYRLAFIEAPALDKSSDPAKTIEGTLQMAAGTRSIVASAAAGSDGVAAVGWFRRRIEHMRCNVFRDAEGLHLSVDVGGVKAGSHVPVIAELASGGTALWRPRLFRFIMLGGADNCIKLPEHMKEGPLRVLIREPFFGFRALAEVF